jgi:hypothetical protein
MLRMKLRGVKRILTRKPCRACFGCGFDLRRSDYALCPRCNGTGRRPAALRRSVTP